MKKKATKKKAPRKVLTLESFAGQDMLKMKPLELVDFSLAVMRYLKAKPSRLRGMIHGRFVTRNEEGGETINHGLCGCAVGAIAILDGAKARNMMAADDRIPSPDLWACQEFGFDLMASLSRVYEGTAVKRMLRAIKRRPKKIDDYRNLCDQPAQVEDVEAVIRRLVRLRPQVEKMQKAAKPGDDESAYIDARERLLRKADPEFGEDCYIPEDLRTALDDLVDAVDYGGRR